MMYTFLLLCLRTETAGILMAICKPGPASIASDSLGVVNILQGILQDKPRKRKNWNLLPNGDLWEHIFKFVTAKGKPSVSIKWVKGHTDAKDVQKGPRQYHC